MKTCPEPIFLTAVVGEVASCFRSGERLASSDVSRCSWRTAPSRSVSPDGHHVVRFEQADGVVADALAE